MARKLFVLFLAAVLPSLWIACHEVSAATGPAGAASGREVYPAIRLTEYCNESWRIRAKLGSYDLHAWGALSYRMGDDAEPGGRIYLRLELETRSGTQPEPVVRDPDTWDGSDSWLSEDRARQFVGAMRRFESLGRWNDGWLTFGDAEHPRLLAGWEGRDEVGVLDKRFDLAHYRELLEKALTDIDDLRAKPRAFD